MFDIGFSEVLVIFVIALVVLGPEKLPRLASQVGRWIGRARAMARQFREQLEEEVNLEQVRRAHEQKPKSADTSSASTDAGVGAGTVGATGTVGSGAEASSRADSFTGSHDHDAPSSATESGAVATEHSGATHSGDNSPYQAYQGPDPADFRADTFSHAHPTNELGANPHSIDGAADPEPTPTAAHAVPSAAAAEPASAAQPAPTPSEANVAAAQPEPAASPQRTAAGEAYASNTTPAPPAAATREPTTRPATEEADRHGQS